MACISSSLVLLLIHFVVIRRPLLLAGGLALLVAGLGAALYGHIAFLGRPAQPPTLPLPARGYKIFFTIIGLILIIPFAITCLSGAGIGALAAWLGGFAIPHGAWMGFLLSLFWSLAMLAYAALKIVIMFLQVRPNFPPWSTPPTEAGSPDPAP